MSVKTPNPSPSFLPPEKFFPAPNPSASIDKDEQTFSFKVTRGGEIITPESVECARFFDKHANAIAQRKIKQAVNRQITTLLDNLEQSIKQHTVPEGSHLVTRSYVLNAIKFAKSELTKEMK